jgi:hypothetical protein
LKFLTLWGELLPGSREYWHGIIAPTSMNWAGVRDNMMVMIAPVHLLARMANFPI